MSAQVREGYGLLYRRNNNPHPSAVMAMAMAMALTLPRRSRGWLRPSLRRPRFALLVACLFFPFLILHLSMSPPSQPQGFSSFREDEYDESCAASGPTFSLDKFSFCTGARRSTCFPRVRHLCISSSEVTVCETDLKKPWLVTNNNISGGEFGSGKSRQLELPLFMRFAGERSTLPLVHRKCPQEVWIDGVSLVADQRFLPGKKPNPHHEAEKLIPATFFTQHFVAENITLYWFSPKEAMSEWGNGYIKALGIDNRMKYVELPRKNESPLCFKDAILFSAPTNVRYIPDQQSNEWLRRHVLQHCSLPIVIALISFVA